MQLLFIKVKVVSLKTYTAITRAKGMVVIVGSVDALRRMVRNNRVARRETFLKKLILEANVEASTEKTATDMIRERIKLFGEKKPQTIESLDDIDDAFFNKTDDDTDE